MVGFSFALGTQETDGNITRPIDLTYEGEKSILRKIRD